ncbi:MAG: hypothetical protein SOZ07_08830 [Prevotella sp.]|nr:hypothetical protein [Prevotellaceae bacterium]MDY3936733.1 hypothetical protein [Prevotella sp.]
MKCIYIAPQIEIIEVDSKLGMMTASGTSRSTEVGSGSTNSNKEHYNDPTGNVEGMDGGESLGKWNPWDSEE